MKTQTKVLTLKEVLKAALLSYDSTLIIFNKDYTSLTIKDFENGNDDLSDKSIKTLNSNNHLIIDKNELNNKEIVDLVKEFYFNNIEYTKTLNKIKFQDKMIKKYSKDILNHFNFNNYARVLVSKDLKGFVIFNFNERFLNESEYLYELIINNKTETWSKKAIKNKIKEFFNERKYFIKE